MFEDIGRFIRKFILVAIANKKNDKEKLVILELHLKYSTENLLEQSNLKNVNTSWNEVKEN